MGGYFLLKLNSGRASSCVCPGRLSQRTAVLSFSLPARENLEVDTIDKLSSEAEVSLLGKN